MLSFLAPEGWEMPPDAKPGQPFQAVGTFIADPEGNLSMTEIDGSKLADAEMPEEEASEMEEGTDEGEDQGMVIKKKTVIKKGPPPPEAGDEMEMMMERAKKAGVIK